MPRPAAAPGHSADSSAEYRRAARRLRGRMAGRTAAMHHALGELARREDDRRLAPDFRSSGQRLRLVARRVPGQRAAEAWTDPDARPEARPDARGDACGAAAAFGVAPAAAERLAAMVRASLANGVLCYSRRLDLLRAARQLGIGRFEANLVMAAVLHGPHREQTEMARAGTRAACGPRCGSRVVAPAFAVLAAAVTAIGIEAALVALAWRTLGT